MSRFYVYPTVSIHVFLPTTITLSAFYCSHNTKSYCTKNNLELNTKSLIKLPIPLNWFTLRFFYQIWINYVVIQKLFSINVSFLCRNTCNYYLLVLFMINICMTWSINDGIGSFLNYHGDQSAGKYLHNHLLKARPVLSFHSWCHENILRKYAPTPYLYYQWLYPIFKHNKDSFNVKINAYF